MPHGLATRHRTAARVAAIKAPYPGVDTLFPEAAPRTDSAAGALSTAAEVSVGPQPADVEGREDGDGVGERPAGHAEAVKSTSRGSKSG